MGWKLNPEESLISIFAEKTEYEVDMDSVHKQSEADAKIAFDNPETQGNLLEIYNRDKMSYAETGKIGSESDRVIKELAKFHMGKSQPDLETIFVKYPEAREFFESKYLETYDAMIRKELEATWLKTRPPEMFSKEPGVNTGTGVDHLAPAPEEKVEAATTDWMHEVRPQVKTEHELSVLLFGKPYDKLGPEERHKLTQHVLHQEMHIKD